MKYLAFVLLTTCTLQAQLPTANQAETAGGNLPIQKIGPDDLLGISVYDAPELTRSIRVSSQGIIRLPMLKQTLQVAGLLPAEVEKVVAEKLVEENLLVNPYVTVTVSEYHSRPISVMGAVRRPITFQAIGEVTLLDALARAEGLTPDAGGDILLSRASVDGKSSLPSRIPVKALLEGADAAVNVKLTGGEEIRIPEAGRVFVLGNVKKPGAFGIHDSSETTVMKALAFSEGLTPYANGEAYIYRLDTSGSKQEIAVPLKQILNRKRPDIVLQAGDILYVPDAKGTRLTLVALEKALIFGGGLGSALIYAGVR